MSERLEVLGYHIVAPGQQRLRLADTGQGDGGARRGAQTHQGRQSLDGAGAGTS